MSSCILHRSHGGDRVLLVGDKRQHNKATNPPRLLKRKHEDNGQVRFLNQLAPAKSEVEYLKPHADEESRLRAVILSDFPYHMPEVEIALHKFGATLALLVDW
jgi:hypothetical protein